MGRIRRSSRRLMSFALLGLLAFASGCGDDASKPAAGPAADAADKQRQQDERAAREKAFGQGSSIETPKK
jgi:hypothetical protein